MALRAGVTDRILTCGIVALILAVRSQTALGSIVEIHSGDSFKVAVERLKPGDTLIVHHGTYSESARVSISVKGSSSAPIVVAGAEREALPLITRSLSGGIENTIYIENASHLTLKGLEITGNGGDGIRLLRNPSYVTLENLVIHDVDIGINFRSDMHHLTVRGNHIYNTGALGRTGQGMYAGCNYAECVVRNSLIERNWIHDTFRGKQGDGIEIKRGSHSNVIRDNTIYNTNYPCIILYGTEGKERNLVEGNVVWNCGEAGIQAAADAIIRNNIVFGGPDIGFLSQDHQEVMPNNLEFVHNTVVGGSPCIELSNWSHKVGLVFANNAVYCDTNPLNHIGGLEGVTLAGNVIFPRPRNLLEEAYIVGHSFALDFVDISDRNAYPSINSSLIAAGDTLYVTEVDFNGIPRGEVADVGAYAWVGEKNPGWKIRPGFKETKGTTSSRGLRR
jgi:hypothetical protein